MVRIHHRWVNRHHRAIHQRTQTYFQRLADALDDARGRDDEMDIAAEVARVMDELDECKPLQVGPFETPLTYTNCPPDLCLELTGIPRPTLATIADHLFPDERVPIRGGRAHVPRRDVMLVTMTVLRTPGFRWQLCSKLRRHDDAISRIARAGALYLSKKWASTLSWPRRLVRLRRQEYTDAVRDRFDRTGIQLNCRVGFFIDCHIRRTCRPIRKQRSLYTKFKKCHGLKCQTLVMPDGIMAASRAFSARVHDFTLMRKTRICDRIARDAPGVRAASDGGYHTNGQILRAPPNSPEFAATRVLVEWVHEDIMKCFPALEFRRFARVLLTIPAAFYAAAVIIRNAIVCVSKEGGQVAKACRLEPPDLDQLFDYRDALPVTARDCGL